MADHFPHVQLIRPVPTDWRTGPGNGMRALQAAMFTHQRPEWFHLPEEDAPPDAIPWYWAWTDRQHAIARERDQLPYIVGPNMLFAKWDQACALPGEKIICHGHHCRLHFTESPWYARWIRGHLHEKTTPVVIWPYPIDPIPPSPTDPKWDLLVFDKRPRGDEPGDREARQLHDRIIQAMDARFPRNVLVTYGRFQREHLAQVAQRSRACLYLSDTDRGPLALAEILLSGCPAVGHETGAPWCFPGRTGLHVDPWTAATFEPTVRRLTDAVELLREWDRRQVRRHALDHFDVDKTLATIYLALDRARRL